MILHVLGARPNFVKMAPVILECKKRGLSQFVVHTGQHYDKQMSDVFFQDLNFPQPDINLKVQSRSSLSQIAEIMSAFEKVCLKVKPSLIVVPGDVNSSLACAVTASKLNIPLAHLEAGLRSFDSKMQEEKNRIVIDHLCDLLFVTEKSGAENLIREGIAKEKIYFCGNTMMDSLKKNYKSIRNRKAYEKMGLKRKKYILMTMHRPENVDSDSMFENIVEIIRKVSSQWSVVIPVHPRISVQQMRVLKKIKNLYVFNALGYLDFVSVMKSARLVLTDSGGVQEETTYLGVPCLTLRNNTERPITVQKGTNQVVGLNPAKVLKEIDAVLEKKADKKSKAVLQYWDGKSSKRIVSVIEDWMLTTRK